MTDREGIQPDDAQGGEQDDASDEQPGAARGPVRQILGTVGEEFLVALGAFEAPGYADFGDIAFEYRRLFSEVWGTFLLVLVAAGAGVVGALPAGHGISLEMKVMAPGFMVMAVIYFLGSVSGAHLNPAVTWAFALRGNFPWRRVPGYVMAQLVGALLAAALLQGLFGGIANGSTMPGREIEPWTAAVVEGVLTLGLVAVILGTASGARNIGTNSAIAVGFYIALAGMWAAPVSGASMNPVRSLGPDVVSGTLTDYWVYLVGPLVGATIAVGFQFVLRGKATAAGSMTAQGVLGPENPSAI